MLLAAITAYLMLQLAIGVWVGRFIKGEADYFLAGRSLGLGLASISLFATWFGAETVMGSASAIAREGLAGSRSDPFGYSLCLLLMAVFLAYKMRAANYVTLGDFFRERFGTRVEKIAVIVFAPTSLLWAAAQLLALSEILGVVTGIPQQTTLIGSTIFILIYTIVGGMKADVIHDVLQGAVVVIGLGALAWVLLDNGGGIIASWERITPTQLSFIAKDETLLQRLDTWSIPVLGSLVAQEALSRLLATRTASIARKACFIAAGIYFLVGLLPVVAGLMGPHIAPEIAANAGDPYIIALARNQLSPVLYVLLTGALIAAILSTIDSTLLSLSALLEHNLLTPLLPQDISEISRVKIARFCVAASGIAAYLFASSSESIYSLLEMASSFGSAGILVTVLIGLNSPRFGDHHAALATLAMGVGASLAAQIWQWDAPYLTAIALCLSTYLIMAIIQKTQPALPSAP